VSLGQRLRAAFEAGAFGRLGDLYAENAVLDWSMPGRRAHAIGSEAVVAQLGEWWRGRGELTRWDESAFPSGLTIEFERLAGGALARQRHFIQTVDGRIVRHQAYCARPQGATVEPLEDAVAGAVRAIGKIDRREPLTHAGQSGTGLERMVMAEGGCWSSNVSPARTGSRASRMTTAARSGSGSRAFWRGCRLRSTRPCSTPAASAARAGCSCATSPASSSRPTGG